MKMEPGSAAEAERGDGIAPTESQFLVRQRGARTTSTAIVRFQGGADDIAKHGFVQIPQGAR